MDALISDIAFLRERVNFASAITISCMCECDEVLVALSFFVIVFLLVACLRAMTDGLLQPLENACGHPYY